MLKLKEGYHVPFPEKLSEGYEMEENSIVANVGVDKLEEVIQHFIAIKDEPLFLFLNCRLLVKRSHQKLREL